MVYTVILKWLSFKQDLSDIASMINDQPSTYAILRYADDIPQSVYSSAMESLLEIEDGLTYPKLLDLLKQYKAAYNINMTMDEEHDKTIELVFEHGLIKEIRDTSSEKAQPMGLVIEEYDDDDEEEEITIIRI